MNDYETFYTATVEALYFTDTGDVDEPPKDAELAEEAEAALRFDCAKFWKDAKEHVEAADQTPMQAGHDFWLTRNGHGAGFWDGDWPEPQASILTELAKGFGDFDTYEGDDGLIHGCTEWIEQV